MAALAGFTPGEVSRFRELFNMFDSDKSGKLSVSEVLQVIANLGERTTVAQVQRMVEDLDTNKDGEIDFQEFLGIMNSARDSGGGGGGGGTSSRSVFSGAVRRASKSNIYKTQGAGNSEHTIAEDEKTAFVEHINHVLASDPFLATRLPMDPNNDDLFQQCADGVVFAKLVALCDSEAVDERALNLKAKLSKYQMIENCNLAINAAKSVGCRVTNIGATDLLEGRPHLILGLAWQIIKASLLNQISLKDHPELFRLLEEGETLEALQKLPPEKILLRWINFHLRRGGSDRVVHNFGKDLADSEAYSVLFHQLDSACPLVSGSNPVQRAQQVIANAGRMNVDTFLKAGDIVAGNSKLQLAFLAQVFNTNPGLAEITEDDMAQIGDQLAALDLDDAGDTREERTFRMWMNSLNIEGLYVNDLFVELCNGLPILQVMDRLKEGTVPWKRVHKEPRTRHHVIDNCNRVVDLGRSMDLVLVNIGGTDIADGNKKLILAIMWQLMRAFTLDMLAQLSGDGSRVDEARMVQWANDKVAASGKTRRIRNLSDTSLRTGEFLIDVCAAVNPNAVNWDLVTTGATDEDQKSNAKYAISIARKIGACVFLTPEDIVEVKPKMLFTFFGSLWATELQGSAPPPSPVPAAAAAAAAAPATSNSTRRPSWATPKKDKAPPPAAGPSTGTRRPSWVKPQPAEPVPEPAPTPAAPIPAPKPKPAWKPKSSPSMASAASPGASLPYVAASRPVQPSAAPAPVAAAPAVTKPRKFNSVNGTGERGGIYGGKSGNTEDEVPDADWEEDWS